MLDPIPIGVFRIIALFELLVLRMPVGIAKMLFSSGGTRALSQSATDNELVPKSGELQLGKQEVLYGKRG